MTLKVNMQLLPMKCHYFLWNAGIVAVVPFMVVYSKQLGFPEIAIGMVYATLPFCKMFLNILLGAVADKYKNQKTIFIVLQVFAACGFISLAFLPALPKNHMANFTCSSNGSAIHIQGISTCAGNVFGNNVNKTITCKMNCPLIPNGWHDAHNQSENIFDAQFGANILKHNSSSFELPVTSMLFNGTKVNPHCINGSGANTECDINCDLLALNEMVSKPAVLDKDVIGYHHFWLLVSSTFVSTSGIALAITFGDSVCLQILGEARYKYGFQRMFGSLGWSIFAIIAGLLIDICSKGKLEKNHTPSFVMAFGVAILSALMSYKLQYIQQPHKANIIKDMAHRLRDPRMAIFMLWCIVHGAGCGVSWSYLFWLLEDLAAAKGCDIANQIKTIEGISLALQSFVGELPFYFSATWIFTKISYINSMTLTLFLMGIQFILYASMSNPWWNLPISVLRGGILGISFSAKASYASVIAPRGTETTTQGMTNAGYQVGSSLGNVLGAVLVNRFGSDFMFKIFGILFIVLGVLHAFVQCLIRNYKTNTEIESNQLSLL